MIAEEATGLERAGLAKDALLDAARLLEEANARFGQALEGLGGAPEHQHHYH